jgi:hypothetical protein
MSDAQAGGGDLFLHTNAPESGDDEEIKTLYFQLQRLENMLNRMGPQAHSNPPAINLDEIRQIRQAIKTRFILHEHLPEDESDQFIRQIQDMSDNFLLQFSHQRLKHLLAKLRMLPQSTQRVRVYRTSSFRLPEPALPYDASLNTATMLVVSHNCHI